MNHSAPILHIDDDFQFTRLMGTHLRERVGDVVALNDASLWSETIEKLDSWIILLDIDLPGIDGLEILEQIRKLDGDRRVIVVTGTPNMNVVLTAMSHGADFIFFKHEISFAAIIDAITSIRFRRFHWERAAATATRSRQRGNLATRAVEEEFAAFRAEYPAALSDGFSDFASLIASTTSLDPFGEYLVKRGEIPPKAIAQALEFSMKNTPLLGHLAVSERLLSMKQVFAILEDQSVSQSRFGEAAVRLGFLNAEQVESLLERQRTMRIQLDEALVAVGAVEKSEMKRLREAFRFDERYVPQQAI